MRNNLSAFILKELGKTHLPMKATTAYVMIVCPFHDDRSPSCGVNLGKPNLSIGYFNCFACGKKGEWNVLAKRLGLELMEGKDATLKSASIEMPRFDDTAPDPIVGYIQDWRNLKAHTLQVAKCYYYLHTGYQNNMEPRICFPLYMDELIGYSSANVAPYPNKKRAYQYLHKKGNWVHNYGLYPFHLLERVRNREDRYCTIVEGIRDALRLWQDGFPAVANLGAANNWGNNKRDLLLSLGFKGFNIMMDSDLAGIGATNVIAASLKNAIPYKIIRTKEIATKLETGGAWPVDKKLDPGNAPIEVLQKYL